MGRTGTFITIDHVLEQAKRENVVDIPGTRQKRTKMVQTLVCGSGVVLHVCSGVLQAGLLLVNVKLTAALYTYPIQILYAY